MQKRVLSADTRRRFGDETGRKRAFTEGAAVQPGTQINVLLDGEDVIERLERYAQAIARKLLSRYDSGHDDAWHEDITQSLLLAGWQVWPDRGDEAKARHRMRSRAVNEKKRLYRTLTEQPRPIGSLGLDGPADDCRDGAVQKGAGMLRRKPIMPPLAARL